ncbi:MAG: sialidase family protein [Pirellulaceae bacterium]|nr:sialidase family protein [Pirellulaceae bacterium]
MSYSCSKDGGLSFAPPQVAFQVPNMSLGMRRGPRIVATGKSLVVTAVGGEKGKGQDGDVLAWTSPDGGESWIGPTKVNDVADSAREGLHAMAAGADGTTWCVWLDLRAMTTELYASKSTDGGVTWSANTLVYRSPEKSVCQCCHPSIAMDGANIHVLFRNSLDGNRDMYIVSSLDGGHSFLPAQRLGQGNWALNACPMDGGMLAIGPNGSVSTVWRRGGELFFTTHKVQEAPLGKGEQPWLASSKLDTFAVWTEGRVGRLRLRQLSAASSRVLDEQARDPMIVSSDNCTVACWESIGDSQTSVVVLNVVPLSSKVLDSK